MIVDVHTQVFPPEVRDRRDEYLANDPGFREVFSDPELTVATADDLLASMDEAGIDVSVIAGFAWTDGDLCRRHSDYLLEAAAASAARLIPFCMVHPGVDGARDELKRLAARGARGLGELRPDLQGYRLIDSEEADLLAWGAQAYDLALLFHVSEPVGPAYPGKTGLPLEQLGRFIQDFPGVSIVAGGFGGGLPFYALMPEMAAAMRDTYVDTAQAGLRYAPQVFPQCVALLGADHVLFGSGYPRVDQAEALRRLREAPLDEDAGRLVLGGNAVRLLRI